MPIARASGRGNTPSIRTSTHTGAYSRRSRIQESVTVTSRTTFFKLQAVARAPGTSAVGFCLLAFGLWPLAFGDCSIAAAIVPPHEPYNGCYSWGAYMSDRSYYRELRDSTARRGALTLVAISACLLLFACSASSPGSIETMVAQEAKRVAIAGKNLKNPLPDTPAVVKTGQEHFSHHCQVCHGLDGHNTGVPFANKMSPNIPELSDHS